MSGALPLPAARPWVGRPGPAARSCLARVCARGDPAWSLWRACPARYRAPGLPRGGVVSHRCEGRLVSGDLPLLTARLWGGRPGPAASGFRARALGAPGPISSPTACAFGSRRCALCGWQEGIAGWDASRRCEGRLWLGAHPLPAARPLGRQSGPAVHLLWAHACGCGDPALSLWRACPVVYRAPQRWRRLPWEGTSQRCKGQLVSSAIPLAAARPWNGRPGSAAPVFEARVVRVRGPITGPTACALASQSCALWEWQEGVPGRGTSHLGEGRLPSGALPPPAAARPWGWLPGSAAHLVWARVCGCGDPAPAPRRPLLRAGVALCGGGRRVSPEGAPRTVVRVVCGQALSLPLLLPVH